MKKTMIIFVIFFNILFICSCTKPEVAPTDTTAINPVSSVSPTSEPKSEHYITGEFEKFTFEELVLDSNAAVLGEYVEMIDYDPEPYVEYRFLVKDCLYGDVTDKEIFLYELKADLYSDDGTFSYKSGKDIYSKGNDYMLVTERYQSIMYDHDRYLLAADIILNETEGKYVMFSEPIVIPEGKDLKEYILSIYNSVPHKKESPKSDKVYADSREEMIGESDYVGIVDILSLTKEKMNDNSNIYTCKASSLSKGYKLNTYEDGTFLLSLMKGMVEPGNTYEIGFDSIEEGGLIYIQSTKNSIFPVN
ncbi:MAG: hypothetical protein K6F93_00975 [Lachnospiraceae bacterium]|nr:hypothetical protein [Lachnospiraceae bacterium]